ncbi:MAG: hypothetical protein GX935_05685 [Erysipelotrichia bacterium]|nr:hypothetical protein [Erysipelotrichia bacterium]
MKKIKVLTITLLTVLLIAGCGNKTAKISNGSDILIQFGNTKITKADLYSSMLEADSGYTIINIANKMIANAEIETTAELLSEAQEQIDTYKASLTEDWKTALEKLGFETEEQLLEQILTSIKSDKLITKYIDENFEALAQEYAPLMARMIYIKYEDNDIEKAKANAALAINEIKTGVDFKTVAEKYSTTVALANENLYTRYSEMDYNVLQYLLAVMEPTLSPPIENNNSSGIYIIQVTKTNIEQVKEAFIDFLSGNDEFITKANNYYFTKHNFTLYDVKTFEFIKEGYPSYLPEEK